MLEKIGCTNIDNLVKKTGILQNLKKNNDSSLTAIQPERALQNLKGIMSKNQPHTSFLGQGYYNNNMPSVIKRHIIENPGWYTAYTPYQSEISQGRLESQHNFQCLVQELTGMDVANASLLDEASAAGEALNLSYAYYRRKRDTIVVADDLHPQTLDVLETRARTLDIRMDVVDIKTEDQKLDPLAKTYTERDPLRIMNYIFQYPNTYGDVYVPFLAIEYCKQYDILSTALCDLLALTKLITPGELGVDIALGSAQRLGVPLWYGGPHPAFFATQQSLLRLMPGRIVGKSVDSVGNSVYRLGLQTREQHIKRAKATSNICTSQSLLTNVVAFYGIYHGGRGLTKISKKVNKKAKYFLGKLQGINVVNRYFYDTITIIINDPDSLIRTLKNNDILVRKSGENRITISFDETIDHEKIDVLLRAIRCHGNHVFVDICRDYSYEKFQLPNYLRRTTPLFSSPMFESYPTETELMRYMYSLSKKDYSLINGMIPLGSCTMKLNAAHQLEALTWSCVRNVHPYAPQDFAAGYQELIETVGNYLKQLTGFGYISFQPNSGATGEYSGLLCIKKYHESNAVYKNNSDARTICLIPKSAHGTNFASAAVANLEVVAFDDALFENVGAFREFVADYADTLACLMITYPNTNGVFQENIVEINEIIHQYGGLVYMDGANMNANLGIFSPNDAGFDVCHLNLHKTFCIPHGGGGPGLGPILCNDKLAYYLPSNSVQITDSVKRNTHGFACGTVAASDWSSASLLTIPYLYIASMGIHGLTTASQTAILNANYLKHELRDDYTICDVNSNGMVGHEFIIDVSEFKKHDITENDIAKRLMDYSFHPPTMSWPRPGVLMIEPTESESVEELDRFVNALRGIRAEISEIIDGTCDRKNNVLKNAPHTFEMLAAWEFPYSFEKAFYPVKSLYKNKFEVPVGRINDVVGDKQMLTTISPREK